MFFKNSELKTLFKVSEKHDFIKLDDYLGIFIILTCSGIPGNVPVCAVPGFVLCTSFW